MTGRELTVAAVSVLWMLVAFTGWAIETLPVRWRRRQENRQWCRLVDRYHRTPPATWPFDWSRTCPELLQQPGWRVLRWGRDD